ncbi:MAG TPA: hypothetical protein VGS11_12195 [Candidatus Bathyarchaeia archaeon]|nr:hypothetical protein [Candidatus Bathyarchaeia archaeon]
MKAETKLIPFYGNGPYCYSNTASMLLSTIGEQVSPREMEAYTGVGLGAFWLPKEKLLFFSSISNPPDLGITRALHLLGFGFEEKMTSDPGQPPTEQLRSDLATSAAVLGPLDMGFLTHNPLHKRMMGADHFVLAYRFEKDGVMIHDPEGFPSVLLPFRQLELAWRADSIPYHRGHYRYWTYPRRIHRPSQNELYDSTLRSFKEVYSEAESLAAKQNWTIDSNAIMTLAKHVKQDKVSPAERGFMVFFSLKLGARRALDFANFFGSKNPELARMKEKQAELFGASQTFAVLKKWARVADSLEQLAQVEAEFRDALISS